MTNYTSARDALVTHINNVWTTAYPIVPIYYENTTKIDLDKAPSVFLLCEINFTDSVQSDIDLGVEGDRTFGEVVVRLFRKEGSGVRYGLTLLDFLKAQMKLKNLSGVYTQVPFIGRKYVQSGWSSVELITPFNFYSNT